MHYAICYKDHWRVWGTRYVCGKFKNVTCLAKNVWHVCVWDLLPQSGGRRLVLCLEPYKWWQSAMRRYWYKRPNYEESLSCTHRAHVHQDLWLTICKKNQEDVKKKGCRGRGKRNPQKEHFAHLLVKSLAACAQKSPNLWKLPGDLNTRGQTNTLRTYDKLGQTLQHGGFWWLLDVLAKILQTRIDVPRIKVPKRTLLPLSLGLGSLERWGYVHQPRRLEVKDLACAGLKETLWFCILHVRHCVPQWSAKFAHENPKQTSRPVSGNAPLVYMQRCIAGESCCHLEVGTNEKLEVVWKVNLLWRVWQHGAESVVKKKCKGSLRGIMR